MYKPPILLFLQAISLLSQHVSGQPPTQPTFVSQYCTGSDTAEPFGAYTTNLKTVLVELQNQELTASYYNTSAGSGPDKVYVQYYCRGDIGLPLCSQCIQQASHEMMTGGNCSYAVASIVWYLECTLRYDNHSAVGVIDDYVNIPFAYNTSKVNVSSDLDKFNSVITNTMQRIINKAAYGNGSHRFATGEGIVSPTENVYCLVQCSPDLNGTTCEMLANSVYTALYISSSGGQWKQWMYIFLPTCQMRYSTQGAFYTLTNATPPSSPISPELPQLPSAVPIKGKNPSYYVVRAVIPAAVVGSLILLTISYCLIQRRRAVKKPNTDTEVGAKEFILFDLKTIEAATSNFSIANILGQGGFGIVYQGILKDGQDIAVKRLSKNSGQGTKEFKTEVAVVAKLQHRNLVQLMGCCADREERLLVYEFLRNLSLDRFLFDETRSAYLTWEIRHKIILGIARGLHYLHEDSRVKIVHRDLKTSNILLDDNLDPKIADFGMARLVKVDQTSDNTSKVVGTYGYMSPEYALAGRYSTKSDVYSFGVIVLEIMSGKSNNRFYEITHGEGLLSHAWRVWNEGTIEQLMDPSLENNFSKMEAERCLQMGLLCVQDDEANRPTMQAVLVMLNRNTVDLSPPISPSHYNYINKLSDSDETQDGPSKQQAENDSNRSSDTLSSQNPSDR